MVKFTIHYTWGNREDGSWGMETKNFFCPISYNDFWKELDCPKCQFRFGCFTANHEHPIEYVFSFKTYDEALCMIEEHSNILATNVTNAYW